MTMISIITGEALLYESTLASIIVDTSDSVKPL